MNTKFMLYAHWAKHHLLKRVPRTETPIDIVSYPKSGRTWMRMILGYILCEKYQLDKREILNTEWLAKEAALPRIAFTHAGSGFSAQSPPCSNSQLTEDILIPFARSQVILLVRNPRDVLVSSYLHASRRDQLYTSELSDFIRTDTFGVEKILKFYNIWYRYRWYPKELIVIKYEDIHTATESVLRKVLQFMDLDCSDALIASAVEYSRFDNMQLIEKKKLLNDSRLSAGDVSDPESYKVRRGVVNGYADYLSVDDIQYIDHKISIEPTAFVQHYK